MNAITRRPIVAVLTDNFPPTTHGGAIRALAALVEGLSPRIDFRVITRDHDFLSGRPLPIEIRDAWTDTASARVLHLSRGNLRMSTIRAAVVECGAQSVFMNSLFSRIAQRLLWSRWIRSDSLPPVILAPEGELSPGALKQKPLKKKAWMQVAAHSHVMQGIVWKAAAPEEASDISRAFPDASVWTIPYLPRQVSLPATGREAKIPGRARLLFLSRIARVKNLPFLLKLLQSAPNNTELTIVGPIEDKSLWHECQELMRALPASVQVVYRGECAADDIWQHYLAADAFVLPTLGENYGYAIEDALRSGCIPIISDRTPWNAIEPAGAGAAISLEAPDRWLQVLNEISKMNEAQHQACRLAGRKYLDNGPSRNAVAALYEQMFVSPQRMEM